MKAIYSQNSCEESELWRVSCKKKYNEYKLSLYSE